MNAKVYSASQMSRSPKRLHSLFCTFFNQFDQNNTTGNWLKNNQKNTLISLFPLCKLSTRQLTEPSHHSSYFSLFPTTPTPSTALTFQVRPLKLSPRQLKGLKALALSNRPLDPTLQLQPSKTRNSGFSLLPPKPKPQTPNPRLHIRNLK